MNARSLLDQLNNPGFYVLDGSSFIFHRLVPGRFSYTFPYLTERTKSLASVRYKDCLLAHGHANKVSTLYRLIIRGDGVARDVPLHAIKCDIYEPDDYSIVSRLSNLNRMIKEAHLSDTLISQSYEKWR